MTFKIDFINYIILYQYYVEYVKSVKGYGKDYGYLDKQDGTREKIC